MANRRLSELNRATEFVEDDEALVTQGGISKRITADDMHARLLLKSENLADVADPAVAISNIGGLVEADISQLIEEATENLLTRNRICEIVGSQYDIWMRSEGHAGGLVIDGIEGDYGSGRVTRVDRGAAVLTNVDTGARVYVHVPLTTFSPALEVESATEAPKYLFVEYDEDFNTDQANYSQVLRGKIVWRNTRTAAPVHGYNLLPVYHGVRSGNTHGLEYRFGRALRNFVDRRPRLVYYPVPDSRIIASNLTQSAADPVAFEVWRSGRVTVTGTVTITNAVLRTADATYIKIVNVGNVGVPSPRSPGDTDRVSPIMRWPLCVVGAYHPDPSEISAPVGSVSLDPSTGLLAIEISRGDGAIPQGLTLALHNVSWQLHDLTEI